MNACRTETAWELSFAPLFEGHRGWAFPSDARGQVDLDASSDRARDNDL
jgi:hypothetical protein